MPTFNRICNKNSSHVCLFTKPVFSRSFLLEVVCVLEMIKTSRQLHSKQWHSKQLHSTLFLICCYRFPILLMNPSCLYGVKFRFEHCRRHKTQYSSQLSQKGVVHVRLAQEEQSQNLNYLRRSWSTESYQANASYCVSEVFCYEERQKCSWWEIGPFSSVIELIVICE